MNKQLPAVAWITLFPASGQASEAGQCCAYFSEIGREDTRFLPGEESCKKASWRTSLRAKTNNLRL